MEDHSDHSDHAPPSPSLVRKLWLHTKSLQTRNTVTALVVAVVVLVGIAAVVLALWTFFSIPTHPVCVDPKIMTAENAKLQVRVLASDKTPSVVNQCLTVKPGSLGIGGRVVNAELTVEPCDVNNVNQTWTVNGMTVMGDVLDAARDGIKTNLFSLSNAAGQVETGATTPWRLVSPCAMRSIDFTCVDSSQPCIARLNNNGAFNQFAPCAESAASVASKQLAQHPKSAPSAFIPPPSNADNRPLRRPPVTAATLHSPEPFFLFNTRVRDDWCGFHVQDHSANALPGFQGLEYDPTLQRVVWGPTSDLVLGFVSVNAEM